MKILIIDYEEEFLKKISLKFEECSYEVKTYTTSKLVSKEDLEESDIVLVNKRNITNKFKELKNTIILIESNKINENENTLYKYQSFRNIKEKVDKLYSQKALVSNVENTKLANFEKIDTQNKVILLFSLVEDYDASNMVIKYLNNKNDNLKVMYVDFKTLSNLDGQVNFSKRYSSIINVFYDENLDNSVCLLNKNNVYTFYPTCNAIEYFEIPVSEKIRIIEKLKRESYEYIIINLDNKFDFEFVEWLKFCDYVFLFTSKYYIEKTKKFYNTISNLKEGEDISEKIYEIDTYQKEGKIYKRIEELLRGKNE